MAGRTQRLSALVLRAVDYGEADRIITLLTRELGVLAVLARSVRRGSRRFPGGVPALALLDAEVGLGRGEVGRLAQAAPSRGFPRLLVDLEKVAAAGRAVDLVRRLAPPRQPEPALFDATLELFGALEEAPPEGARALEVAFRARAASIVGLEPTLDRCGECGKAAGPDRAALFDPAAGALVCRACGGASHHLTPRARAALLRAARERWREAFVEDAAAPAAVADVASAEGALAAFLDFHTGRSRR